MFLDQFFSNDEGSIRISRQQASTFAKRVAGDFNPIHNEDAKRFVVPGDLLFALILTRYGVSQKMHFNFEGMVGDATPLHFPESEDEKLAICDENGKTYLTVERSGDNDQEQNLVRSLACSYVEFSGQTFPHILVPLMKQHNVMINTDRPLVIYESMSIDIDRLDITDPKLELSGSSLEVEGKRGNVRLDFNLMSGDEVVGRGSKSMVLSGLREYDQQKIDTLVSNFNAGKEAYAG
ncbi:hypothetical protein BOW53_07700 [Solemya pervernicosa gill symbiont]|uniref:DUF3581 domain-containing protein n=2 Tax=Gammaproteobacteria incertae sedis TaxID=118884 RepID=A0A1T2L698_9GAMM|nr:DUF3581 domain-containing protein [Candidatus Reidiella endopervernicosa]OOZ40466.1 hypothetical protein BOW53_07700 [Solemya pervernicosa gill symbiont]QKQ25363.1 DUF3581 domain-containing protein [Candidatus Reidiella endopervernicosa]